MSELLKRWFGAVQCFVSDMVRLQNYCSIPYLMVVNSLFCFVCFYATREVQLRSLYCLIGFVFCADLLIAERKHNLALAIVHWAFADFIRSISVGLLAYSVHTLNQGNEQRAFAASLGAVCGLVVSPLYHHHNVNAKLFAFAQRVAQALKRFLVRFVVRPLQLGWEWLKFLLLLRWLPMLGARLRSWLLAAWDWLDARLFSPLCAFGRGLKAWFRYLLLLHWCADLWRLARRTLLDPLCVQLGRLLDAFIYVFGCYWLKPLLIRIGRATGQLAKAGLQLLGRLTKTMLSLTFEHLVLPLLLLAGDQLEALGIVLYERAGRPLLALIHRKYKQLEDLVLIHALGPLLKRLLDTLPQRSVLEQDSDHELDEFLPDLEEVETPPDLEAEFIGAELVSNRLELPDTGLGLESISGDRSSLSSEISIEEEAKVLASGLRGIDISGSDSDTDAFLPVSKRRRRAKPSNPNPTAGRC